MAQEADSNVNTEKVDPELEYLKKKSAQGAMNLVGDFLGNPEIKKAIMRKVAMPIIAVAYIFIGVLGLCDVAKQLLGFSWQTEAVISVGFILIGLIYLLKNMLIGKRNDK